MSHDRPTSGELSLYRPPGVRITLISFGTIALSVGYLLYVEHRQSIALREAEANNAQLHNRSAMDRADLRDQIEVARKARSELNHRVDVSEAAEQADRKTSHEDHARTQALLGQVLDRLGRIEGVVVGKAGNGEPGP